MLNVKDDNKALKRPVRSTAYPLQGVQSFNSAGVKRKAGGLSQKKEVLTHLLFLWAHQGMILGPPDYESGALTN